MDSKQKTVAIGCDHAAINFKNHIIKFLESKEIKVIDCGTNSTDAVDYSDYAKKVCDNVVAKKSDFGIVICGTGIGMSIAANKVKGIRCALCSDTFSAKATRLHNDANVLALGERVLGLGLALDIVNDFIFTNFSNEERHIRRIDKISKLEC